MSLWTPYAEAPLDLTKPVKLERRSPAPPAPLAYVAPAPCYPCPCPYYGVPSAQMSPLSQASTCSSCEQATPPRPPSPPPSPRRCALDADAMSDDPDFQAFERDALRAMAERNGGSLLGHNPRMRRAVKSTSRDAAAAAAAGDSYRQQRERNNFAAKQSRDRRKLREIHLALKVAYLKNELAALRARAPPAPAPCARCRRPCAC